MRIQPLADVPAAIPQLAEWFFTEWQRYDGRSRSEIEAALRENLNRDAVPITFVALVEDEVVGTISLDLADLPSHGHLSPWLASLYVVPSRRGQKIGHTLVQHLIDFARRHACSPIYLWTAGPTRLYEDCGFRVFGADVYAGDCIKLMELALQ